MLAKIVIFCLRGITGLSAIAFIVAVIYLFCRGMTDMALGFLVLLILGTLSLTLARYLLKN